MVVINLTFFIELGLFLAFLWAVQALVFRPLLKTMDEREEIVDANIKEAQDARTTAETIEVNYERDLSSVRRKAVQHMAEVRRDALSSRATRIQEQRKAGDAIVAESRKVARQKLDEQRSEFDALSASLAENIVEQLSR